MTSAKMEDVDSLFALEEALSRVGINEEDESSDSGEESSEQQHERSPVQNGLDTSDLAYEENGDSQLPQIPNGRDTSSSIQETSQSVNLDLARIIEDHRTFTIFRRFLRENCIIRNLQFWLACEHYRQISTDNPNKLHAVAQAIYVKFLKNSAPQYVSVSDQTKRNIKICLELRGGPLTFKLFCKAQAEIRATMERNEVRQFLYSDEFASCSSYTQIDSVYTPNISKPVYGVCGGGSLQLSGSEDSASVSSFSTDDGGGGPRSTVAGQLTRPFPTTRKALSDTEGPRMHKAQHKKGTGVSYAKDKSATQEEFFAMVRERLLAVHKDRETMTQKVRDQARKQGKMGFDEIMGLEWYDLPETCKYIRFDVLPSAVEQNTTSTSQQHNTSQLRPPSSLQQHIHSPIRDHSSITSTPRSSRADHKMFSHVQSLAAREVEDALKDLEIANEVSRKKLTSGSSSVHTTSDSGVGVDMWPPSSFHTAAIDRTRDFCYNQDLLHSGTPERDRDARAAAIALMSNSPHPDSVNPRVPAQQHDRPRRFHHQYVRNFPGAYSDSDTSSCATMSSTSELFIPRRMPPANTVYSDDTLRPPYPPQNRAFHHHRRLSAVKRSPQLRQQQHNPASPSPITEHRPHMPSQQQQPQQQRRSQRNGETLIVYHLCDMPTPYAKRLGATTDITLGDFKEKVFARNGDYRFFFKCFCDDLQMEIMEEYSDDSAVLPLVEGKIIGRVEKKV